MQIYIKSISIVFFILLIVGCQDERAMFNIEDTTTSVEENNETNSSNEDNNVTDNNVTKNITIVSCDTNNSFTTIESGDILIKTISPTKADIRHLSDGTKKVCIKEGSAYLERL